MNPTAPNTSSQSVAYPPLTIEEEDHVILTRITNDERPLRRIIKKFHAYTSVASHSQDTAESSCAQSETAIEESREAFLVEIASFHLLLKKSAMICEGEARQVEEYESERLRIEDEHGTLKGQIEQLKTSLEHALLQRRRKLEYDAIAEKVNTLPSREDLEQSIQALESDMAAIRSEHDTQDRIIRSQKSALDSIIANLGSLRFVGKDVDNVSTSAITTPRITPLPDDGRETTVNSGREGSREVLMEIKEEKEEGALTDNHTIMIPSEQLEPQAKGREVNRRGYEGNDIEMGELEEDTSNLTKGGKVKRTREELEEGEASDESSELSEPPE